MFANNDFDDLGRLSQLTRYEGIISPEQVAATQYVYDELGRLTSMTHKNPDGTTLVSHGYQYDAASNLTRYLNSIDGNVDYTYDATNQLTGANYDDILTTDESYTYDANGNRVTANGSSYTTGLNNQLLNDGTFTYTYDLEGNRTSKTHNETGDRELYEYDHRNRLIRITSQRYDAIIGYIHVQIVEYAYDYNNVWVRKLLDTNSNGAFDEKTLFIPEGYQTVLQLEDTDLSDNVGAEITHRYLLTPDTQDKLLADSTSEKTLWILTDHLGSIRDIIENTPTGIVTPAHIIYDAYGNVISCKDSTGTDIDNLVLFGYTGKAFDTSTSLQNNINRWYDATIGRWLTTDPISFAAGDTNLYRYAGNDSVSMYDPTGLATEIPYRQIGRNDFRTNKSKQTGDTITYAMCYRRIPIKVLFDINSYDFEWHNNKTSKEISAIQKSLLEKFKIAGVTNPAKKFKNLHPTVRKKCNIVVATIKESALKSIVAVMVKENSPWYTDREPSGSSKRDKAKLKNGTEFILEHEQGHFKIAQIHALLLQRELATLSASVAYVLPKNNATVSAVKNTAATLAAKKLRNVAIQLHSSLRPGSGLVGAIDAEYDARIPIGSRNVYAINIDPNAENHFKSAVKLREQQATWTTKFDGILNGAGAIAGNDLSFFPEEWAKQRKL